MNKRTQNQHGTTNIEESFSNIIREISPGLKTVDNNNTMNKKREENPSSHNNYNISTNKSTIAADHRSSPLVNKASVVLPFQK